MSGHVLKCSRFIISAIIIVVFLTDVSLSFASSTERLTISVKHKMFGAKGDAKTDDTASIQKAVNWVFSQGGGVILFPPGTYLVTSVNIREKITFLGDNATIERPPNQPRWTRTFTNHKNLYSGLADSKPLIVKGLTFDGNSRNQGSYKKYELEHSDLLFLAGSLKSPGKLQVVVEDCTFKNGVSDGIALHENVSAKIVNCTAENLFRGGIVLGGHKLVMDINGFKSKGQIDPTGIHLEDTFNSNISISNVEINDGNNFDIGVSDGSKVIGKDIFVDGRFNVYAKDSRIQFSDCTFRVSEGRIVFPYNVTFNNCSFYAKTKKTIKKDKIICAAPLVAWNISGTAQKYQSLIFNECKFMVDDKIKDHNRIYYGICTGFDSIDYSNVLTVNGGYFSKGLDIGVGMQSRGGNWVIRNATIEAGLPLSFTGFKDQSNNNSFFNIILKGMIIKSQKYAHIGGYGSNNLNRLQQDITIDESANYITSTYGVEGNNYIGQRVILGTTPPTSLTNGIFGDIYQLKEESSKKWKCIKAGYLKLDSSDKIVDTIKSEWRIVE